MTTTSSNVDLSAAKILSLMKNNGDTTTLETLHGSTGISLETLPFFSSLIKHAEAATDDRENKVRNIKWLQRETDKRCMTVLTRCAFSAQVMISCRKVLESYIVRVAQRILKEIKQKNLARRMAATTTTSAGATRPPPPAPVKRKHTEQPEKDEDEEDDSDLFTSEETRDISRRRF